MLKSLRLFFLDRLSQNLRFIAFIIGRSIGKNVNFS